MAKGGQTGSGPKFDGLGDMFNGGGAGASGGAFKGHNGFTNAMAAIGNGLSGQQPQQEGGQQIPMPPRPAMPQMPQQQPQAPQQPAQRQWGESTGPHAPSSPGPAQGPLMPYGQTEISDDYIQRLIQRANQGDQQAAQLLSRYDQGRL